MRDGISAGARRCRATSATGGRGWTGRGPVDRSRWTNRRRCAVSPAGARSARRGAAQTARAMRRRTAQVTGRSRPAPFGTRCHGINSQGPPSVPPEPRTPSPARRRARQVPSGRRRPRPTRPVDEPRSTSVGRGQQKTPASRHEPRSQGLVRVALPAPAAGTSVVGREWVLRSDARRPSPDVASRVDAGRTRPWFRRMAAAAGSRARSIRPRAGSRRRSCPSDGRRRRRRSPSGRR